MDRATSISLSKLTETVQAAVKVAVQKHPKFRTEQQPQVVISYLIRGIPVPEGIAANATVRETQAFATDLAAQIGAGPQAAAPGQSIQGAFFSLGKHLIIGFPVPPEVLIER